MRNISWLSALDAKFRNVISYHKWLAWAFALIEVIMKGFVDMNHCYPITDRL